MSSYDKSQNVFEDQIPDKWKKRIAAYDGRIRRTYPGRRVLIPGTLLRENFHRIKILGTTTFHDYETIGPDEHADFGFMREAVLSTEGPSVTLLNWVQGFGGEERVEIDIDGSLNSSTGALLATMNVRFYEGATEGTTELEMARAFVTVVPVGRSSNFDLKLFNDEDDWARVFGSISNSAF